MITEGALASVEIRPWQVQNAEPAATSTERDRTALLDILKEVTMLLEANGFRHLLNQFKCVPVQKTMLLLPCC